MTKKKGEFTVLRNIRAGMVIILLIYIGLIFQSKGDSDTPFADVQKAVVDAADDKNMTLAGTQEIKRFYGINPKDYEDFRLGLTYGSEADYLYNQSTGNAPAINFFFAEDADIINLSAENRAKIYYLDITDEGSNYNSIFTLFNGLRGAEAPVQYRVRNGLDSEQSAQTGIYSMSYYIGEQLIKK